LNIAGTRARGWLWTHFWSIISGVGDKPTHLGFRADAALTERLDDLAKAMSERLRGVEISRSAVMKLAVETALPELELEYLGRIADKPDRREHAAWIREKVDRLYTLAEINRVPVFTEDFVRHQAHLLQGHAEQLKKSGK
jgi:hypothetical protein